MSQAGEVHLRLGILLLSGCGASIPPTRHYRLDPPAPTVTAEVDACPAFAPPDLVIDDFRVDAVYDDQRIAYRESPYRVRRYHYHRWGATPGKLVSDALRRAYDDTGLFRRVTRRWRPESVAELHGRVVALEELDATPTRWLGRVELELELVDPDTERTLWTESFTTSHRLQERSPEGLAAAVSKGVSEIAADSAADIASAIATAGPCSKLTDGHR